MAEKIQKWADMNINTEDKCFHSLLQAEWQYSALPSFATDRLAKSQQVNF